MEATYKEQKEEILPTSWIMAAQKWNLQPHVIRITVGLTNIYALVKCLNKHNQVRRMYFVLCFTQIHEPLYLHVSSLLDKV